MMALAFLLATLTILKPETKSTLEELYAYDCIDLRIEQRHAKVMLLPDFHGPPKNGSRTITASSPSKGATP